jgi:hypothetical protein
MLDEILDIQSSLLQHSIENNFAGADPFDGLNSKLFNVTPKLKSGLFGLVWIQLFKNSPANLRPFLGVPKKRNPKGIGLFILGLLEDYKRTSDATYLKEATTLADWLLTQKCDQDKWQHACWGYHFDWKARAFYVPQGKPNVITTIYVSQALFALANILEQQGSGGVNKFREPALDSANFIVNTLYTEADGRSFFAYIPGESAFVHNASLWAAAWVSVVGRYTQNTLYCDMALKVARQSASEQSEDGSWVYGARHHHQFIDGFHTGYNLEALDLIRKTLDVSEFDESIEKGLTYYKAHFFDEDGTAKYYNNNRYPLDMHSVAQAVITLLKVGGTQEDFDLAEKVINWSINELYLSDKKRFVYQKTKRFVNKINYTRWTQAWVYYSFSYFNQMQAKRNESY